MSFQSKDNMSKILTSSFQNEGLLLDEVLVQLLENLWTDPNIPLFYDRQYPATTRSQITTWLKSKPGPKSVLCYWAKCFDWAVKFYMAYKAERPKFLVSASTPHQAKWYIRLRVAESLEIPIYIFQTSRIQGYSYLCLGLQREAKRLDDFRTPDKRYITEAQSYLGRCKAKYMDAIPFYERERIIRQKGKLFRPTRLIKDFWYKPEIINNTWKCWKALERNSVSLSRVGKKKCAIFYLHYQPERTTLPEGYGFTQQLRAIITLRSALPSDFVLLVKEHPSIFTNICSPTARDVDFYEAIARLPGVSWVNIKTDNFELIDSSCLTASICGTVNTESLIRGRPTVIFGIKKFQKVKGQHFYKSLPHLKQFVSHVRLGRYGAKEISSDVESSILNDASCVVPRAAISTDEDRKKCVSELIAGNGY